MQGDARVIEYLNKGLRHELTATPDGTIDGARLIEIQPTPSRRACLFLGMLEMARVQQLELLQNQTFGPIYLKPLGPAIDDANAHCHGK